MFGDAGVLSFQLDNYRWEDHIRRMRDIRERDVEHDTAAVVAAQYNDLVRRYNALAEAALKAGQLADASQALIKATEAEVRTKDDQIGELQRRLSKAEEDYGAALYSMSQAGKSADYYMARALAAEDALRKARSQDE